MGETNLLFEIMNDTQLQGVKNNELVSLPLLHVGLRFQF